jgi:NAD(P) transhydrogenase
VLYLTGLAQRELYGSSYRVKSEITVADLLSRTQHVVKREIQVVQDQLARNRVQLLQGAASFVDEHTVSVDGKNGQAKVSAQNIVIATGTRPARPKNVAFDERRVLDSDGILMLEKIPASLVVVGAGVIGIEYASIFAALGTKVTVVEQRDRMLDFCDDEVVQALQFHLRELAVSFRFRETVSAVEVHGDRALVMLASGKSIPTDAVMYSAGRMGATSSLGLDRVNIVPDERGRIHVDKHYRTSVPNVYAVGDVIGFPALAATSMEQGRLAAYHAFGEPTGALDAQMPIGIYTLP